MQKETALPKSPAVEYVDQKSPLPAIVSAQESRERSQVIAERGSYSQPEPAAIEPEADDEPPAA